MTVTLYGIPNCDTVRKARKWLETRGVACRFHDFRNDGLPADRLRAWADAVGWEVLLNRRSATWRQLPAATREGLDAGRALVLLAEQPTLIRRPVVEHAGGVEVGFDPARYEVLFG